MRIRDILPALAAVPAALVGAHNVCQVAPYSSLLSLSGAEAATTACMNATLTRTQYLSTTKTACVTAGASVVTATEVTVTETNVESTTITVTVTPTAAGTVISTETDSFKTTKTTYVTLSTSTARRRQLNRQDAYTPSPSVSCATGSALPALAALSADQLATACSCLNVSVPTALISSTATPTADCISTTIYGDPPTTTLLMLARATVTKTVTLSASTTYHFSAAISVTSTSTVSLAAPTFTQVYGPKAGCADIAAGPAQQLDSSVTNQGNAIQLCKALCAQIPSCESVYVQHLFTDYGGAEPYFGCFFSDHHLNVTTDLECGKRVGTFGTADAFDAYGRG